VGLLVIAAVVAVKMSRKSGDTELVPAETPVSSTDRGAGPDFAKTTPRPTGETVRTTFEEVASRKFHEGQRVEFPAVILPVALLRIEPEDESRYHFYTLAVPKGGHLFRRLQRVERHVTGWIEKHADLEAGADDLQRYVEGRDAFERLAEGMEHAFWVPSEDRPIAVRLQGFEGIAHRTEWESLEFRPPDTMASARDFMERWRRERESEGPTLAEVAAAIGKLEGEVPPSLDSDLPDMDRVKDRLESQSEVDRYNELVPRFNAELIRRRRFSAQSMLEVALAWRAAARRLLSEPERTLRAEIISPAYVLGSGFRRMKQSPGSEVVAERMPSEETFAARYYERTTIFLTSYPNGATVKVDGKRVGVTPLEIPDREVGGRLEVEASLDGHETKRQDVLPAITANGVQEVRVVLRPRD
jgi:hypothetical protein